MEMIIFVFVMAAFLGMELISKVPSQLHTPLMSGTNAISGITRVGALAVTAVAVTVKVAGFSPRLAAVLGFIAVVLATINFVRKKLVNDRMLGIFRQKGWQAK